MTPFRSSAIWKADDNVFTWDDVEVTVIGGDEHRSSVWRFNREQVIEDVITGLRLYPWVLGRSHGTTKNWVEAQFNLLMQIVDSVQKSGCVAGQLAARYRIENEGDSCEERAFVRAESGSVHSEQTAG